MLSFVNAVLKGMVCSSGNIIAQMRLNIKVFVCAVKLHCFPSTQRALTTIGLMIIIRF